MSVNVVITKNFNQMSEVATGMVKERIIHSLKKKPECVLGLATGSSPTGVYKQLARAANVGELDSGRIRSFNLDEYVGLPGENAQQRMMHPESYCYFMIQEFFGLLKHRFIETAVPFGTLIDQKELTRHLKAYPDDWREAGADAGRWIVIRQRPGSEYLAWVRRHVLDAYAQKIRQAGGIDVQIIGVGGRGHVAFHEAGIPFKGSRVMLVRLDENTVENAVKDGHFSTIKDSPRYAVTMGAELIYQAGTVVLLASGHRKVASVAESLLGEPTPNVPISYGQIYGQRGGELIYVVDRIVGKPLLSSIESLKAKGIGLQDLT